MNRRAMVFAAVVTTAFAFPGFGQQSAKSAGEQTPYEANFGEDAIRRIEQNYLACLTDGNDGVLESAIANCVRMRWALPSAQLEDLKSKLGALAVGGNTAAVRYKAYLAEMVYDTPSIFSGETGKKYTEDEDLFDAITVRAQKALLGANADHSAGR